VLAPLTLVVTVLAPSSAATAAAYTVLPDGTVGKAYVASLKLPDNATAIRPASGTLPSGLRLGQSPGSLSGDPTSAGTYLFVLTYDDNGVAETSQPYIVRINKGQPQILFGTRPPANPTVGQTYVISAGSLGLNPVTFSVDSASSSGTCTVNVTGAVRFTGVGTCIIDADEAGNANYLPAPQVQQSMIVGQGTQTIRFTSTPPANPVVGGKYHVSASGGPSGITVLFSVPPASRAVCTVDADGVVAFIGAGSCVVEANQAGDTDYLAAAQIEQTIEVGPPPPVPVAHVTPADLEPAGSSGGLPSTGTTAVPLLGLGAALLGAGLVLLLAVGLRPGQRQGR
jgi:Putative Ig domain